MSTPFEQYPEKEADAYRYSQYDPQTREAHLRLLQKLATLNELTHRPLFNDSPLARSWHRE